MMARTNTYAPRSSSVVMVGLSSSGCGWNGTGAGRRGLGEAGGLQDLVLEVEGEPPVFDDVRDNCGDVARVHLAGMNRDSRRQIGWGEDRHAIASDGLARHRQLAIPSR